VKDGHLCDFGIWCRQSSCMCHGLITWINVIASNCFHNREETVIFPTLFQEPGRQDLCWFYIILHNCTRSNISINNFVVAVEA
jgi:hypothetical protein